MHGIFNIDKPIGMTSHDVVQAIRKLFKTNKVGHLGTLDPMATGVLPIAVGKASRLAQFISGSPKEYEGDIRFGFATDTYDARGKPTTEERPLAGDVSAAMRQLTGTIEQTPPAFSAKKVGGKRAYKLARRNQAVSLAAVEVDIERFEIVSLDELVLKFRVVCSPGTYIRSLAHDLGVALGCGAHLAALRRTRSGDFRVEDAVPLDRLSPIDLIPIEQLLPALPRIEVSGLDENRVAHGNPFRAELDLPLARIFNKEGQFIAIAAVENGWARPRLVLT